MLITRDLFSPILGMNFLRDLGVVTNLQCSPITCFDNHFSAGFRLKTNVSSDGVCFPARSLPFSMKILVENELQRLLQNNVIYAVQNPTISAPIVPVVKQAGASHPIRLCGDYSCTLNKIIDRDLYRIPMLKEILEKIANARVYSVIDLEGAYLQVSLTPDSQLLTCISTHIGHFAFRKLQFSISAAPLIFQEIIDKVLCNIPYVAAYQDDIVIGAPTQKQHDKALMLVKLRLQLHGFKLNHRKSQISRAQVKFLGFSLTEGKVIPCENRLKTFSIMPLPKNKNQLRSALCTLRHYGVFCKGFSHLARCLYSFATKKMYVGCGHIHIQMLSISCVLRFQEE